MGISQQADVDNQNNNCSTVGAMLNQDLDQAYSQSNSEAEK